MKKRLFVTGLTGFVRQHIQARLLADASGWELLPVPSRYDLGEPDSLECLWPQVPDAVIQLAGQTFVPEAFRDPARTLNINVLGTLNLLQALKARGFVGTFLYVSSGDVYGQVSEDHLPITELQPPYPRNPYAVSKLSAEFLSLQWGLSEGWSVLVARPFKPHRSAASIAWKTRGDRPGDHRSAERRIPGRGRYRPLRRSIRPDGLNAA